MGLLCVLCVPRGVIIRCKHSWSLFAKFTFVLPGTRVSSVWSKPQTLLEVPSVFVSNFRTQVPNLPFLAWTCVCRVSPFCFCFFSELFRASLSKIRLPSRAGRLSEEAIDEDDYAPLVALIIRSILLAIFAGLFNLCFAVASSTSRSRTNRTRRFWKASALSISTRTSYLR